MSDRPADVLGLFEGYGIELEYMIVDRETLDVKPIADELLRAADGGQAYVSDVELDGIAWSNELALHVIELKTNGPAARLEGLPEAFSASLRHADGLLEPMGARLLPSAMHPWMDPHCETRLWPHEYSPVYEAYNRIFDCRGHGWGNLQSMHVNLPFADDREFDRLHSAIRLVLPILPALAASSPIAEGRPTGALDTRLEHYRRNSDRVPSVCGRVIPEVVGTRAEYQTRILERIYADLAPFDPAGVLQYEFANARGAIARFDRSAIEIRLIDVQECAAADIAIAALVAAVLRALVEERPSSLAAQRAIPVDPLADLLGACIAAGERARVDNAAYLGALGLGAERLSAGEVWAHLAAEHLRAESPWRDALDVILEEGPLARRILRAAGPEPSRDRLAAIYRDLGECLLSGRPFRA